MNQVALLTFPDGSVKEEYLTEAKRILENAGFKAIILPFNIMRTGGQNPQLTTHVYHEEAARACQSK